MKYIIAILTLTFALSFTALAGATDKTTSGLYFTANDFTNGKLTYEGQDSESSQKLQLHNGRSYLEVKHGNEITKLSKSEVYGFRDSHGRSYRFVGNEAYEIREAGPLYIYQTKHLVTGRKGAAETVYLFSVGPTQPVVPLTIANLRNAVPEDRRFQDILDMAFRNDSDLTRFDKSHTTYAVNRLFRATANARVASNNNQHEPMQHMTMANCMEHCQTAESAC